MSQMTIVILIIHFTTMSECRRPVLHHGDSTTQLALSAPYTYSRSPIGSLSHTYYTLDNSPANSEPRKARLRDF